MIVLKILGNLIPAIFGIYAIKQWKSAKLDKSQIGERLGFRPFSLFQLMTGLVLGALVFSIIFLTSLKFDLLEINQFSWTSGNLLTTVLMFSAGAIGEELIFRSFFINGLKQFTKSIFLILTISAFFFSMVHWFNDGSTLLSSLSSFLGGLMYGYAFIKTEKLWLPVGLHFSWNFFQSFVYGFPVSGYIKDGLFQTIMNNEGNELWTGGAYGPEGGLFGILARIVVIVLSWLIMTKKYGR